MLFFFSKKKLTLLPLQLASSPQNRPHMIPEGQSVPPGLVMFLDHPSSDVVLNALETFYYLSLYPPNRTTMIENVHLMPRLKQLMTNGKTSDIKRKAIATFTSMKKAKDKKTSKSTTVTPTEMSTGSNSVAQKMKVPLANSNNAANSNMRSFGFGGEKVAKNPATTITVFMKELGSEANKTAFERSMVNYKGIVSFWVELRTHKAVVRTTLSEEKLTRAIMAQLGWIASTDAAYVSPGNADYLDDGLDENAKIVPRASKKKARQEAEAGGWFSSVASYIW